jgi:hypothetical protein
MLTSYAPALEDKQRHETECEHRRRRGGQPGNRNGVTHGQHTRDARAARKASHAILKAAAHLIVAHGLSQHRVRPRPLRSDQLDLLRDFAPEIAGAIEAHLPPGFHAVYPLQCRRDGDGGVLPFSS